ncbi:hypothetical protein F5148DRAFT_1146431 [Russula earlei]|uniref:Uncharacterized protein n=1 Tax=Russula earlei TaxID=71964 RepID=A0ACC0UK72_9AGAM|nr:hypothetical protein F5148DRAFT_1146431 [Russula earlei]
MKKCRKVFIGWAMPCLGLTVLGVSWPSYESDIWRTRLVAAVVKPSPQVAGDTRVLAPSSAIPLSDVDRRWSKYRCKIGVSAHINSGRRYNSWTSRIFEHGNVNANRRPVWRELVAYDTTVCDRAAGGALPEAAASLVALAFKLGWDTLVYKLVRMHRNDGGMDETGPGKIDAILGVVEPICSYPTDPVMSLVIKPVGTGDREFFSCNQLLRKEYPTFRVHVYHETEEVALRKGGDRTLSASRRADDVEFGDDAALEGNCHWKALKKGTQSDKPVSGVRMVLRHGAFHALDSSEQAFRLAAIEAFREAYLKTKPNRGHGPDHDGGSRRTGRVPDKVRDESTAVVEVALNDMCSSQLHSATQGDEQQKAGHVD